MPLPFPLLPLLLPLLSQLLLGLELLILVRVPRPTFLYCLLPTDAHRLLQNQLNLLMDKLEGMQAMGMYLGILMLGMGMDLHLCMGMDQLLRLHNQQKGLLGLDLEMVKWVLMMVCSEAATAYGYGSGYAATNSTTPWDLYLMLRCGKGCCY